MSHKAFQITIQNSFKPSEYPPIGTNWTNWKIYLQKNEEEAEEMSPDFYTRLGKSGIKIDRGDDKYYTVDEILNLKFGNLNSVIQREKKAFAIAALFSIGNLKKNFEK